MVALNVILMAMVCRTGVLVVDPFSYNKDLV